MGLATSKWVIYRFNPHHGNEEYLIAEPEGLEPTEHVAEASGFATAREAYNFAGRYDVLDNWRVGLRS